LQISTCLANTTRICLIHDHSACLEDLASVHLGFQTDRNLWDLIWPDGRISYSADFLCHVNFSCYCK